jgi:hypothetical protein
MPGVDPQLPQIGSRFRRLRGRIALELALCGNAKEKTTHEKKRLRGKHTRALPIRISTAEGATLDTPR